MRLGGIITGCSITTSLIGSNIIGSNEGVKFPLLIKREKHNNITIFFITYFLLEI